MAQTVIGAILGTITGGLNFFTQQKALKQQEKLAQQQYENTKKAYELEQQERNKQNGKQPDLDALLESNTASARAATDLTGGKVKKTKLFNAGTTSLGVTGNGS